MSAGSSLINLTPLAAPRDLSSASKDILIDKDFRTISSPATTCSSISTIKEGGDHCSPNINHDAMNHDDINRDDIGTRTTRSDVDVNKNIDVAADYIDSSKIKDVDPSKNCDKKNTKCSTNNTVGLANLYHEAALQKMQFGEFREAITFLKKALAVSKKEILLHDDHDDLTDDGEQRVEDESRLLKNKSSTSSQEDNKNKISEKDTAQTAFILGMIQLNQLNDPEGAEESLRFALDLRTKILEKHDSATIVTRGTYAQALERQGKFDLALPLYEEGVRDALAILGDLHQNTGFAYAQIATCLLNSGTETARAVEMFSKALSVHCRGCTGRGHELRSASNVLHAIRCFKNREKSSDTGTERKSEQNMSETFDELQRSIFSKYGDEIDINAELVEIRRTEAADLNVVTKEFTQPVVPQQTMT